MSTFLLITLATKTVAERQLQVADSNLLNIKELIIAVNYSL